MDEAPTAINGCGNLLPREVYRRIEHDSGIEDIARHAECDAALADSDSIAIFSRR
jgi:hypothetical protein